LDLIGELRPLHVEPVTSIAEPCPAEPATFRDFRTVGPLQLYCGIPIQLANSTNLRIDEFRQFPILAFVQCTRIVGSGAKPMTHPAFRAGYNAAMSRILGMIVEGAGPAEVAAYVLTLRSLLPSVSRAIEDQAMPGTFAEAVFNILAD
jgi:hypothetical protein